MRAIENFTVREQCGVADLLHSGGRVTGVRAKERGVGSAAVVATGAEATARA